MRGLTLRHSINALAIAINWATAGAVDAREPRNTGSWVARFDRRSGETIAAYTATDGSRLAFVCDSAGPRPGLGRIEATFVLPPSFAPVSANEELVMSGEGRSLPTSMASSITAMPPPGRTARHGPDVSILQMAKQLDGTDAGAAPMRDFVAFIQSTKRELVLKAASAGASMTIKPDIGDRVLKSFAQGCQNFLPAEDDEVIWDWHQGLTLRDGARSITLVAQSAPQDAGVRHPLLTLQCHRGELRALINGVESGFFQAQQVQFTAGEHTRQLPVQYDDQAGGVVIDSNNARLLADLLRRHTVVTATPENKTFSPLHFRVAGFSIAARLMARDCDLSSP